MDKYFRSSCPCFLLRWHFEVEDMRRVRRRRQRKEIEKKSAIKAVLGWIFQIFVVVLIAYVVVFFFGQTRTNVGQSMNPTLAGGDTVLLNELSYKLKSPARGDVIAFKVNGSNSSYIRRVIGLPGETVQIKDGAIYINDEKYEEDESIMPIRNAGIAEKKITLNSSEYFVLSDNRDSSEDSRSGNIGAVNKDTIIGKAWFHMGTEDEGMGLIE